MSYFFDTSALVKIYHQEENSKKTIDIFNSTDKIYVTELSVIEFHSVVYRKFREKQLDEGDLKTVLKRFSLDLKNRFDLLIFNPDVIDNTKEAFQIIGRKIFIRTLDVIQIGFFKSFLGNEDVFLTYDTRHISAINELKKKNFFIPPA